jgi:hypothetical protein
MNVRNVLGSGLTIAAGLLASGDVWAQETVNHRAAHLCGKRADEVLKVLTAYADVCDSGCKYTSPSLIRMFVVNYNKSPTDYYTWSDHDDVKDSQFFSHVTIQRPKSGRITMVTSVLDPSSPHVAALKKASGKEHAPLSDAGVTRFEIEERYDTSGKFVQTEVQQIQKITVSGIFEMFTGKIREGMARAAAATFRNIGN